MMEEPCGSKTESMLSGKRRALPSGSASNTRVRRELFRYLAGALCLFAITASVTCFTVREGSQALVFRFGEAVRLIDHAGLHFKAPWPIERIVKIDSRNRTVATPLTELLTRDRKNIVLVTGAVWRPSDPALLYRALGTVSNADEKIIGLIVNAKISVFGRYNLSALVSTDAATLQVENMEQDLLLAVNSVAQEKYGVEVIHAGFQRVSLPEQNIAFVLEQMRAERRQHAARFIADGQLQAANIRSSAELEAAKILAESEESAARILGRAEAEAAEIYAGAHRRDPAFYRYVRSLETLEQTLGSQSVLMLRTDSEPFSLLVDRNALAKPIRDLPKSLVGSEVSVASSGGDEGYPPSERRQ